jgi:PGF-pre-PGF domain-containing protein
MRNTTRVSLILTLILLTVSTASADLDLYKGDEIEIENANSTIEWQLNHTFTTSDNSSSDLFPEDREYNKTWNIGDYNISIYSDTPEQLNSTIWRYDFSSPSDGDTLLKVETKAVSGSRVNFKFTNLPSISNGKYVVKADGSKVTQTSSTTVSWSYSSWSAHNFTVTYQEEQEEDSGGDSDSGSSGEGGSSEYDPLNLEGNITDRHFWISSNKTQFKFDDIRSELGIQEITVTTSTNTESIKIGVGTQGVKSPETSNAYRYYNIKTDSEDVESAEITFSVNQNFTQKYDKVVLSRYENDWKNLPTTQLRQEDVKVVYRAETEGFSYFAVKGQNNEEDTQDESDESTNLNDTNSSSSQNETTGDEKTTEESSNTTEPGNTDSSSEQQEQTEENNLPVMLIVGVVLLLVALVGGGFYGYRFYEKRQLEQRAEEVQQKIRNELEDHEIENSDRVYQELDEAEKALQEKDYSQLEKCLDRVEELL